MLLVQTLNFQRTFQHLLPNYLSKATTDRRAVFWKEPGSTNEQHTVLKFGSNGCLAERAVSEYFRATSLVRNVYAIAMEHAATLALLW